MGSLLYGDVSVLVRHSVLVDLSVSMFMIH